MRTYQARLTIADDAPRRAYAAVFSRALRSLHATRHSGKVMSKPRFMRTFKLTSRQYNAVKFSLDGMESSIVELRPGRIADLQQRIKAADKKLAKLRNLKPPKKQPKAKKAQHHLEDNGFESHDDWLATWQEQRDSQFFVLGSKDESSGCQGCVMTHLGGSSFALRSRLNGKDKRHVALEVSFAYGLEHILAALKNKQAMSYRFLRDDKGWRVFVSTAVMELPTFSDVRLRYRRRFQRRLCVS